MYTLDCFHFFGPKSESWSAKKCYACIERYVVGFLAILIIDLRGNFDEFNYTESCVYLFCLHLFLTFCLHLFMSKIDTSVLALLWYLLNEVVGFEVYVLVEMFECDVLFSGAFLGLPCGLELNMLLMEFVFGRLMWMEIRQHWKRFLRFVKAVLICLIC